MQTRECPECGGPVATAAPEGLCPKCLMGAGLTEDSAHGGTIVISSEHLRRGLPQPGEQFGGYRIVRELGRGGMGAVYEAEQLESGRYVALKVLGRQLDSSDARKRFLREGRLAASINHPNSVYVFGTEEIEGTPAIAMELVAGGTLQDLVQRNGPLPVPEAVDAILQVIAGLEAAQAIGILHRDVKPSNCFQDADGTTKIGDFGLSMSTAARNETDISLPGTFLGTPAFCSPEQLRGEELNARSDMYSVGVTLFYLLTKRMPFEGKGLVQLLATVLEQPAPSPRKFRSHIPQGLAKIILRCLEKQPGDRFKTYEELRQALAPYTSTAPTPATASLRCVAGLIDMLLMGIMGFGVTVMFWGQVPNFLASDYRSPRYILSMWTGLLISLAYGTLCEGLKGATLGKALCGLRVVGPDRNPPGIPKAFMRALMVLIVPVLPLYVACGFDPMRIIEIHNGSVRIVMTYSQTWVLLLLFATARRRNGFAAVQDLLTRTRVVLRTALPSRPTLQAGEEPLPVTEATPKLGPYHVLKPLGPAAGNWLLGYDARLLRKIWIRVAAPGAPPVAPNLRNLGRPGRLRWISGRRSAEENWDAFEAVTGKPLMELMRERQPWDQLRFWLLDLAKETSTASRDGTLPAVLALDRVWISGDGRAKLLDFPAPGLEGDFDKPASIGTTTPPELSGRQAEIRDFLNSVARAALEGHGVPATETNPPGVLPLLPLHARAFIDSLPTLPGPDAVVKALTPLMQKLGAVTRWRRLALVAGCAIFPAVASIGFVFGIQAVKQMEKSSPGIFELNQVLQERKMMNKPWARNAHPPDDRTYAIYIASHFGATITNATSWSNTFARSLVSGEDRQFAEKSVKEHPTPASEEVQRAVKALKRSAPTDQSLGVVEQHWFPLAVGAICLMAYVGVPALGAALLFRGGLVLRAAGLAVARSDGTQAPRLQVFLRSLAAWSPLFLAAGAFGFLMRPLGGSWATVWPAGCVLALVIWSVLRPGRSLQDWVARTWLVPR